MIKPITLGQQIFPVNIIQGPLAGVSSVPFRELIWQYSQPAFTCTEMISCKTLLHSPLAMQERFIKKSAQEGPLCYQLSSNNPTELAAATQKITDYGADLIDLNCGCPVKKIRSKGAGSMLLTDASHLYQLITAMKKNTHVPVSIKIRVDGNSDESFNSDIAKIVGDAGADFLIVHGRHWTEHYETASSIEQIKFFVDRLKIPVIGNGDIKDIATLKAMQSSGCAGYMLGRAGVGQPWLIQQLIAAVSGTDFVMPTLGQRGEIFLKHLSGLCILLACEKFAIYQARKLAKYYARQMTTANEFVTAMNTCETYVRAKEICAKYFC
jgi:tRNA-dihydrouridine synthase B